MDPQDRPGFQPPAPVPHEHGPSGNGPLEPGLGSHEVVASRPRRSRIGTGVAIAAITVGALGIAGTAYAASSASPTPSPGGTQRPMPGYGGPNGAPGMPGAGAPDGAHDGGRRGMGMGMGGMRMLGGMGIHGSFVVKKQDGTFQTVVSQRGKVTAVSSTSISVASEDGFTADYTVGSTTRVHALKDGIGSVKVGDDVAVIGTQKGSTNTAVDVVDLTQVAGKWKQFAPGQPKPKPSASTSSTTA